MRKILMICVLLILLSLTIYIGIVSVESAKYILSTHHGFAFDTEYTITSKIIGLLFVVVYVISIVIADILIFKKIKKIKSRADLHDMSLVILIVGYIVIILFLDKIFYYIDSLYLHEVPHRNVSMNIDRYNGGINLDRKK
ncbi:MAG: hypothetical protein A2Y24_01205 [Clostridiales bacterium GWE2_32_10]|nr:MAG: hypothetical protein A2Y24_01205 [Clostridiales bacterium GWE2_32_10]